MITVIVGSKSFQGVVHMTFTQYLNELAKDEGKRYMDVYCTHGVESFRIKYFREVASVPLDSVEAFLGELPKQGQGETSKD